MSTPQRVKNNTIGGWLQSATTQLLAASIDTARLDACIILEDQLRTNRAHIAAHPEQPMTEADLSIINQKLTDRLAHKPLAYIRGSVEFYGRSFIVSEDVLVPRPESEQMIELVLKNPTPAASVLDIGTGSGALAITTKLERPSWNVDGIDIDPSCISIAKLNATALGANVHFNKEDLATCDLSGFDIILANLPYVPTDYPINKAASYEPGLALWGGTDGLDVFRQLFVTTRRQTSPALLYTESLVDQHQALNDLAQSHGYECIDEVALIQVFKPAIVQAQPQA